MYEWEPHRPRTPRTRVVKTSCCGELELCSEGGQYLILRLTGDGHEETARGRHVDALRAWNTLTKQHQHATSHDDLVTRRSRER